MSIATQPPGLRPGSSSASSTTGGNRPTSLVGLLQRSQHWMRHLSTPSLLQLLLGATWLCALLFWIAAYIGVGVYRNGLQRVGRDSGVGIIQARRLKTALLDMDASVVRLLLIPADQQDRLEAIDARTAYDTHRAEFGTALIDAAANMTEGQQERDAIVKLRKESELYASLVERALLQDSTEHETYNVARQKLNSVLLPTAESLRTLKNSSLATTYDSQSSAQSLTFCVSMIFGLLLIGVLVAAQYMLFLRTRRLVNPGLGVATLLSVTLFLWLGASFGMAAGNLIVAKQDGFDALDALEKAHAVAQDAKSDEGLWLLLPANSSERADVNKAFEAKLQEVHGTLKELGYSLWSSNYDYQSDDYSDYPDSPSRVIKQLGNYHTAHSRLTGYEKVGSHQLALESYLGIGPQADISTFKAFDTFNDALTNDQNNAQQTFETATTKGLQQLENRELWISLLVLAIAATSLAGIMPRLKEYSL